MNDKEALNYLKDIKDEDYFHELVNKNDFYTYDELINELRYVLNNLDKKDEEQFKDLINTLYQLKQSSKYGLYQRVDDNEDNFGSERVNFEKLPEYELVDLVQQLKSK